MGLNSTPLTCPLLAPVRDLDLGAEVFWGTTLAPTKRPVFEALASSFQDALITPKQDSDRE